MSQETLDNFRTQLQQATTQSNAVRSATYGQIIASLLNTPSDKLNRQHLLQAASLYLQYAVFSEQNSTGGGLVIGRQALSAFEQEIVGVSAEHVGKEDEDMSEVDAPAILNIGTRIKVLEDSLDQLQTRVLSFEEQASSLRIQLANLLEAQEDWKEAAQVLSAIPFDTGHRTVSDHFKLSIYMRIVRLLLEADDAVAADVFLKRASMVIHNVSGALPSHHQMTESSGAVDPTDPSSSLEPAKVLGLQYRLSQARVYDSQRRFAEAAVRYHELSYVTDIDADDRTQMLSASVTASILSPAGPQRARTLATLMRDERTQTLPQYTILSKVFHDHIIRPDEIKAFEKLLSPHQVARLAPLANAAPKSAPTVREAPSTVLDRAMIEHNILSASRLYDNITLSGLGSLVELSPEGAEEIARKMIMQGRLKAWIDQVGASPASDQDQGGVLFFIDQQKHTEGTATAGGLSVTKADTENASDPAEGGTGTGFVDSKWTRRWDQEILQLTNALEGVCQRLNKTIAV